MYTQQHDECTIRTDSEITKQSIVRGEHVITHLEQSNENTNNQRHGTTANIIGKDKNGNGNIDVNYNQLYQ